ncbi:hypothetical protein HAX54_030008 [Datura stramonium]|uniref:Uncharacterized protein n=1 Tax=Datura stramonium TaxID=4076 RepID=A0ABS8V9R1_DATST|nr:hypothetical protein [Datura stramonium]
MEGLLIPHAPAGNNLVFHLPIQKCNAPDVSGYHRQGLSLVGKSGISKCKGGKEEGLVEEKSLMISLTRQKPSAALQTSKRNNSGNELSIGKDLDSSRNKFSAGKKDNYSKDDDVPVHLGASPHALKLSRKSKSSAAYQPESPTAFCRGGRDARTDFL